MGGREDATNVIPSPELCVITSISLDHVGMIGNTLEEIAKTKAGIIKRGTHVIVAPQQENLNAVFQKECDEQGAASVSFVNRDDIRIRWQKPNQKSFLTVQKFVIKTDKKVTLSMLGEYQPENAAVALEALDVLERISV